MVGATSIVFEGKPVGTPDAGEFWRVAADHRVKAMFTAPTAIRAIKKVDPSGDFLLPHTSGMQDFKALWLAGERADPDTINWMAGQFERAFGEENSPQIIDHWWMTETGWPITANFHGSEKLEPQDVVVGSGGKRVPGSEVVVLGEHGEELPAGTHGYLAVRLPTPPGVATTIWNNHSRFNESYLSEFAGFFTTGDAGYIDSAGCVHILSRVDDIINTAGHRLSTATIESCIAELPDVAEVAVVGVQDELKGEVPVAFIVLKDSAKEGADLVCERAISRVREVLGPVYSFKRAEVLPSGLTLPKTRSGKTLRRTLRAIVNDGDVGASIPATIEDPVVPDKIARFLAEKAEIDS
jgi:propionyl-CoA synthetase